MELNKDEIIKALECCSSSGKHCTECVYFYRAVDDICAPYLMADALALIKELTEENERLRAELASRPPKLIITKVNKEDTDAHQMEQTE